ncbi:MAG: hypothetical protein JXB04_05940 [Kiritimatiellae bacterium]|nr:hypothetical protein [Kiritimatiellia bacterium]
MARKYHVEGTRSFLIAAVVLIIFSVFFVWDGWFPRQGVLEKHPDPHESFYLFNKSVAVLMIVSAVVCAYIHLVVK